MDSDYFAGTLPHCPGQGSPRYTRGKVQNTKGKKDDVFALCKNEHVYSATGR